MIYKTIQNNNYTRKCDFKKLFPTMSYSVNCDHWKSVEVVQGVPTYVGGVQCVSVNGIYVL